MTTPVAPEAFWAAADASFVAFRDRLIASGLDLVRPFDVASYDERVAGHERLRPIAAFAPSSLAFLVGNTRAFWPVFLAALRASPALRQSVHPVDDHVTAAVTAGTRVLPVPSTVFYAHEGGARLVGMAALAEAAGLAELGPARLLVHPEHGPWFALRAVIVCDHPPPRERTQPPRPCRGCAAPCVPAFERAVATTGDVTAARLRARHEAWVAVRDACPVGRAQRYDPEQITYHYTNDLARLRRL